MIHLLTPSHQGGVLDFSCQLQAEFGDNNLRQVSLTESNISQAFSADEVVLQYSGYGFHKRGTPLWLLEECRKHHNSGSFGIFYHELYAFGPPWSSSFWLSPVQRYIARQLVEMCDFWMTSSERFACWLRRYAGDKPHKVLPVFSTIGEPKDLPLIRKNKIVVFGSSELRCATYQAAGNYLFDWARKQQLEVHDIGVFIKDSRISDVLQTNGVIQHGRLAAKEVCLQLADAQFGVLAYPVEYVSKSSVFAAYCALGVSPILFSSHYIESDGLVAGKHYLPGLPDKPIKPSLMQSISIAARDWYQPHNLDMHSKVMIKFLRTMTIGNK